jgi:hypothetical protein
MNGAKMGLETIINSKTIVSPKLSKGVFCP